MKAYKDIMIFFVVLTTLFSFDYFALFIQNDKETDNNMDLKEYGIDVHKK